MNRTTITDCQQRPIRYEFFFRGGDCSENDFDQPIDRVECTDFFNNPGDIPAPRSNETAWVRLFERGEDEDPIFEGLVREGSTYQVFGENNGRLPANMRIDTYPPATTVFTPSNIWQSVSFHSSCSQPLLCFNTFGGHQVVAWENERQGAIDCFDDVFVEVLILVTVGVRVLPPADSSIVMQELEVRTDNYVRRPGATSGIQNEIINLSDGIRGQSVRPGFPAVTNYTARIDLQTYKEYRARIFSVGNTTSGFTCNDPIGLLNPISFCAPTDDPNCTGRVFD